MASTRIVAVSFGSPAKQRAMKLAPDASALTRGWNGLRPVPPGDIAVSKSGSVVGDDVGHVDVAPASGQKMIAADGIAVGVAARHHDREVGPRHLQAGGKR